MTDNSVNATIEILGKPYPIRCKASELEALQGAAQYLHQQMLTVQASGKVINLERIAIITALNLAHQFLQLTTQKESLTIRINQRISQLQLKLDQAINQTMQAEFSYSTE